MRTECAIAGEQKCTASIVYLKRKSGWQNQLPLWYSLKS